MRNGEIELRNVKGEVDPADLFTKLICARDKTRQLLRFSGRECRGGRADSAPQLRKNLWDEGGHAHTFEGIVVKDEDASEDVPSHVPTGQYAAEDPDAYFSKAK